jgi:hypothetical protein
LPAGVSVHRHRICSQADNVFPRDTRCRKICAHDFVFCGERDAENVSGLFFYSWPSQIINLTPFPLLLLAKPRKGVEPIFENVSGLFSETGVLKEN